MARFLPIACLLAFMSGTGFSQETSKPVCPTITVTITITGRSIPLPGDIVMVSAKLPENAPSNLSYSWLISKGEIISGQGTASIQFRMPKPYGDGVTATVTVKGLPEGCV